MPQGKLAPVDSRQQRGGASGVFNRLTRWRALSVATAANGANMQENTGGTFFRRAQRPVTIDLRGHSNERTGQRGRARPVFRGQRGGFQHPHRGGRRPDHIPDNGLYRLCQSFDPVSGGDAAGRGLRRHLHRRVRRHDDHGAARQLPDRACAGHGAQRLRRLRRRRRHGLHMAGGAGGGVHVRRPVRGDLGAAGARMDHQRNPARAEAGGLGRYRPVSRHHRAGERADRRRSSGNAGDGGQPEGGRAAAGAVRFRPDSRAELPEGSPARRFWASSP